MYLLFQNARNTNFCQFGQMMAQFWPNLGRPTFYSNFLSNENNISCLFYFRLPSFYNFFMYFFVSKYTYNQFVTNFSKFLPILTNFGLILGHPSYFSFFSIYINISCLLYFRLPSFYNFLCIFFLIQIIPIFSPIFLNLCQF